MSEMPVRPTPQPQANLRIVPADMLESIFQGQRQLMERYHAIEEGNGSPVIPIDFEGELDDRHVQSRLHQLFGFAMQEWSEAMQELHNKPWRQTQQTTDRQAFISEVGDVLHFFVEFCITAGIGAEELHQIYFKMHQKNQDRQNSQY